MKLPRHYKDIGASHGRATPWRDNAPLANAFLRTKAARIAGVIGLCLAAAASSPVQAGVAGTPYLNLDGIGFVQYGDAQSYSLPIANLQTGQNITNGSYTIPVNQGTLWPAVDQNGSLANNYSGMDKAYTTPNGNNGTSYFYTESGTSRGTNGVVSNNLPNTWDISLAALKDFLTFGNTTYAPTFLFQNNQINSGGHLTQSLAAWAQMSVTDASGNIVNLGTVNLGGGHTADLTGVYQLSNMGGRYDLVSHGGGGTFMGDVTTYQVNAPGAPAGASNPAATDYVLSGGSLCVATNSSSPSAVPVPVACGQPLPAQLTALGYNTVSAPINHNLGNDRFSYAEVVPELNLQLAMLFGSLNQSQLQQYTMHLEVRLGCAHPGDPACPAVDPNDPYSWNWGLNNGGESISLALTNPLQIRVPEPGSLLLIGLALGLLGFISLRHRM